VDVNGDLVTGKQLSQGPVLSVAELAAACRAAIVGRHDRAIAAVAPPELARPSDLIWVGDASQLAQTMTSCRAGVVLVPPGSALPDCDATFLVCPDLLAARVAVIDALENDAESVDRDNSGRLVDRTARLGPNVIVSHHAVIGGAVTIGAGSRIGTGCVIGPGVELGQGCRLEAGSIVGAGARIGDGCRIGPGAIISSPPDAYDYFDGGMRRAPAIGIVVLGDRVIVGAGTLIQQGVERATIVGSHTVIGSQCLIGHDSRVGQHCAIGAQSGLAAKCEIGDHVMISVQVGISIGVRVDDRARVAPKSGVMSNIPAGETWMGSPAMPKMSFLRQQAAARREVRKRQ
jgi:UDP-3-O-[3-hydroxymyristoyl] glucosamine N-acyltransferase